MRTSFRIAIGGLWCLVNLFLYDFWWYILEGISTENVRLLASGVTLVALFVPTVLWLAKGGKARPAAPTEERTAQLKPGRCW